MKDSTDGLKTVETVLLAAGALITAAKWLVKFIGYVGKLMKQRKSRSRSFAY